LHVCRYHGIVDACVKIIEHEGAGMLLKGLGATVIGYAIQGSLKYGCYEVREGTTPHRPSSLSTNGCKGTHAWLHVPSNHPVYVSYTGLGATVIGYAIQGSLKYGCYEVREGPTNARGTHARLACNIKSCVA
jgi:hypothetical protein